MTNDSETIRKRIPQSDYLRSEYLRFLIEDGHPDAAVPVARELAEHATEDYKARLLDYCTKAVKSNVASAVDVWNILSARKQQPLAPLAPNTGAIVTNGEFRTTPIEQGFDWYIVRADGVSVTMGAGSGISVELTGEQSEGVTVLYQSIPLAAGASYRIECRYNSGGEDPLERSQASGLAWQIEDPLTGRVLIRGAGLRNEVSGQSEYLDFTAPGTSPELIPATLSLRYERSPGTVRREEKFTIEKVSSRLKQ
jgi:hypothetical protein